MTTGSDRLTPERSSRILIVDDNLLDAKATRRALRDLARPTEVHHLTDGADALAYLIDESGIHEVPDLLLLDLNLPGLRGLEVLRAVMTDVAIPEIPVMILTTSDHESDIQSAFQLGARGYVLKPAEINGWDEIINTIDNLLAAKRA